METQCGTRGKGDFAQRGVFFENVDGSQLVDIEAGFGIERREQNFGAKIDVGRSYQ